MLWAVASLLTKLMKGRPAPTGRPFSLPGCVTRAVTVAIEDHAAARSDVLLSTCSDAHASRSATA